VTLVPRGMAVEALRRAGHDQAADEVASQLPDPVDVEDVARFVEKWGIESMDDLFNELGGSP